MAESQQKTSGHAVSRFAYLSPWNTNATEAAQIRDVSARGICFYVDSAVEQGSPIGFTSTLRLRSR